MPLPHEDEADAVYRAVRNAQGEYALWPAFRELPVGWVDTGCAGTREDVLAWIEVMRTEKEATPVRDPMRGS